jgi:hypothetical protein
MEERAMATWSAAHGEQCATHECQQKAVWHFQAGDVGSDYCDPCHDKIVGLGDEDPLDNDDSDDEDWLDMLCSLGADGQCGQAGSEFCDFECRRWEAQD